MKGLLLLVARRYIAGTERRDAIGAALRLNRLGLKAVIDNMGEDVASPEEAEWAVREYLSLLDDINASGADSNVSLKLTHMGLAISRRLAEDNAGRIAQRALELGRQVRFDMEGSRYTADTIEVFLELRRRYPNLGVAIQSYLPRSPRDAERIAEAGGSIRLVKGAYKEPPGVAFQDKKETDAAYSAIMKRLIASDTHPAIATHDERLINEAKSFAREKGVQKGAFDFEMLMGIKEKAARRLAAEGYTVRIYVPYGRDWLPYTLRRLRERKENIWFVVRNLFG